MCLVSTWPVGLASSAELLGYSQWSLILRDRFCHGSGDAIWVTPEIDSGVLCAKVARVHHRDLGSLRNSQDRTFPDFSASLATLIKVCCLIPVLKRSSFNLLPMCLHAGGC